MMYHKEEEEVTDEENEEEYFFRVGALTDSMFVCIYITL
jgi:hypothetical protein